MFIVPLLIIAGFESGVPGNVAHTWGVSATADKPDSHTIIVTYQGGQDAGSLVGMTATVTDSNGQAQTQSIGSETGTILLNVGEELSFDGAYAGKDHVVATGHFSNGQDLIILDLTRV